MHYSKQQSIYRYHIFLVSGQVNPIYGRCQIITVHRRSMTCYKALHWTISIWGIPEYAGIGPVDKKSLRPSLTVFPFLTHSFQCGP